MTVTFASAALVALGLLLLLYHRQVQRRRRRNTWERHRRAFREYQVRTLARELFRRWRPTPRLIHRPAAPPDPATRPGGWRWPRLGGRASGQ